MADFSHVQQVETQLSECESHRKAVVQIKVAGAAEPLLITCLSSEMAESIADLVDRYCRLVNGTNVSLWNKRGIDSFFSCCFLLFLVVSYLPVSLSLFHTDCVRWLHSFQLQFHRTWYVLHLTSWLYSLSNLPSDILDLTNTQLMTCLFYPII